MNELTLFHFEEDQESFEDLGKSNGSRLWNEADLMAALGYSTAASFRHVITRAMQACLSLNIQAEDNFIRDEDEYKLTRFACYLIAMNGDTKKPQVAAAQYYFAALAETFQDHLLHAENIDRVLIRDEVTDGVKSLGSTAKQHGVTHYAFFINAGYRGMYNMNLKSVKKLKGLDTKGQILDHMGRDELAANLFRITQTDAKIKKENVRGQTRLEQTAEQVGKTVRRTMEEISGTLPEHLPPAEPIREVKKALKGTSKKFKELDKPE